MEDLNKFTATTLDRYFEILKYKGYIPENQTNKLILLQFLQELLQEYPYFVTEQDYTTIERIVQCLSDSACLIPYREYKQVSMPLINYVTSSPVRITETMEDTEYLRHTEAEDALRLVNQ